MSKSLEELKTYCGLMMLDLRGNWGFNYQDRIEYLNQYLDEIINHPSATILEKENAKEDKQIGLDELEDGGYDGRVYRDCANLYGYKSDEGLTNEVYLELAQDMTYPEYYLPDYENKSIELEI